MLLQLAIGPICLFVFQTAVVHGFWTAESGVWGTALVDGTEILLAIFGVGAVLEHNPQTKNLLRLFGAGILFVFGVSSILGVFGVRLLPTLSPAGLSLPKGVFLRSILLALSNPLTVVFWAGIFAVKITREEWERPQMLGFGLGCVLSTLFFLTLVAMLGSVTQQVIPQGVVLGLNLAVGILFLAFGLRTLRKQQ